MARRHHDQSFLMRNTAHDEIRRWVMKHHDVIVTLGSVTDGGDAGYHQQDKEGGEEAHILSDWEL
ncbi:hypothetical protein SESBI_07134 [Sesbania bispinosa]|nr:hypothetical protein SESBI_07134 [Sesbania bispinosa]